MFNITFVVYMFGAGPVLEISNIYLNQLVKYHVGLSATIAKLYLHCG